MLDLLGEKWNKETVDAMNDMEDFVRWVKGKYSEWKNIYCVCSRCVTQHIFDENMKIETIE